MLIKQTRIRNLNKLDFIEKDTKIRIAVADISRFSDKLLMIGFKEAIRSGDTLLPKTIGAVTRRNSEGYFISHKDREKETHYRMIEWTYNQWSGRGSTTEVTESTQVPYKRYPRTEFQPYAIELTAINNNEELMIISPEVIFNQDNENILTHIVNLFLEIFGECQILDLNNNIISIPQVVKLNWEVLPVGKMPWDKRYRDIIKFIERAKGDNKKIVTKRLEKINQYEPDFTAIGNAGFNGYIVHGFINKNIYVLESIYTNNATYILEDDWETISSLTKAEILNEKLHKARIIHSKSWYDNIESILGKVK